MKRLFYIDHNPRASNNVTPYHLGEKHGTTIKWFPHSFRSQDAASLHAKHLCPNAIIHVN